ncbi:hypothetical protein M0R45_009193 [Rubus argutus]|uniref:Homeobox domain-containing protein n=1 Tax=Rubus argutus TaxID=59490 RepID=A0AAW1Y5U9_RUBAR
MPLATFRKLAIGTLQPTSISVQLADETFRMPVGIVEDVLVRVDKFILPADFVILDMDEDPKIESGLPIILGSSFMATAGAKINVQKGTVKLKVLGEKVKLQVLQPIFPLNVIKEQELPEISYSDDDDMFDEFVHSYVHDDIDFAASTYESELNSFSVPLPVHKAEASFACVLPELDLDPHFMGQQSSSFEQAHQLNEFESPQLQEVVKPTSTINECAQGGIPPTPYIPPHRRGILPTPYFHPHEHRLSSSFESFKMTSPHAVSGETAPIQAVEQQPFPEAGPSQRRAPRSKRYSHVQIKALETFIAVHPTPTYEQKFLLSQQIGLTMKKINKWILKHKAPVIQSDEQLIAELISRNEELLKEIEELKMQNRILINAPSR